VSAEEIDPDRVEVCSFSNLAFQIIIIYSLWQNSFVFAFGYITYTWTVTNLSNIPLFIAVSICICQEFEFQDYRWILKAAFQYKIENRES
jgi:hypothetical protein